MDPRRFKKAVLPIHKGAIVLFLVGRQSENHAFFTASLFFGPILDGMPGADSTPFLRVTSYYRQILTKLSKKGACAGVPARNPNG
jgi:hypothetical protein